MDLVIQEFFSLPLNKGIMFKCVFFFCAMAVYVILHCWLTDRNHSQNYFTFNHLKPHFWFCVQYFLFVVSYCTCSLHWFFGLCFFIIQLMGCTRMRCAQFWVFFSLPTKWNGSRNQNKNQNNNNKRRKIQFLQSQSPPSRTHTKQAINAESETPIKWKAKDGYGYGKRTIGVHTSIYVVKHKMTLYIL